MFLYHLGSIVEGWVNWGRHNCSLVRKPLITFSIHGCWPRPHHITINLWRQDILYHAVYWNATPLNWRNCWKIFLRLSVWTTPWKLIRSHAVTPRWLDDAKECIQSGWSNQRDCPQRTKSWPRMLVTSKAAFLENYLAVITWIFNGSSIEYHKKKHSPFSLSGIRFGSRAIQISGWKSACRWSARKWAFHTCLLLIICSKSQRKTHQIPQKFKAGFQRVFEPFLRGFKSVSTF